MLQWLDDLGKNNTQIEYSFPEPPLLDDLVRLYFLNVHPYSPILHQPTFERDRSSELHLRDRTFGGVVLLGCALAARFSREERRVADALPNSNAIGWRWFSQVNLYDIARMLKPNSHIHGLQIICVRVTALSHLLHVLMLPFVSARRHV